VGLARRPWFVILLFGLLIFATRWSLAPGQLFTFDDVNLAYSIGHFDVRISQPHPPGYPLFVLEMRMLSWLHFRRAESILLALSLLGSMAALMLVCYCGNRMLGPDSGFWAAWILVLHPVFWHAGVTSALERLARAGCGGRRALGHVERARDRHRCGHTSGDRPAVVSAMGGFCDACSD
jgi:hypothetical protein